MDLGQIDGFGRTDVDAYALNPQSNASVMAASLDCRPFLSEAGASSGHLLVAATDTPPLLDAAHTRIAGPVS